MDEDNVTLLDTRPHDEGAVARRRRDEQAGRLLEGPAIRYGQQGGLGRGEARGEGTLAGAEDAGADGELGVGGGPGGGDDGASKFGTGDPGERFFICQLDLYRGCVWEAEMAYGAGAGICPGPGGCRRSWWRRRGPGSGTRCLWGMDRAGRRPGAHWGSL